jgi:hypothetical protein
VRLIIPKTRHERVVQDLANRYIILHALLDARPLTSAKEGAGSGTWAHPEDMVAITGKEDQIRVAIADIQTILKEIQR